MKRRKFMAPSCLFGRFAKNEADRARHLTPATGYGGKLLPPLHGKPVELCFAVVFTDAPLGQHQAPIFEAVKSRIQRPLFHLQSVLRRMLDNLGDRMTMR